MDSEAVLRQRVLLGVASLSVEHCRDPTEGSSWRSTGQAAAEAAPSKRVHAGEHQIPGSHSILCDRNSEDLATAFVEPDCFKDLLLDQIVDSITVERDVYQLRPYFYTPLVHLDSIAYRQAVFRDLEDRTFVLHLGVFARHMQRMRDLRSEADQHRHPRQKQRGFVEAVDSYCAAVNILAQDFDAATLGSVALRQFRDYLCEYQKSAVFQALGAESAHLKAGLAEIQYRLQIEGLRITVSRYESDPDFGEAVARTFEKFRQNSAVREYHYRLTPGSEFLTSVEAAILDRVARLFPDTFNELEQYCVRHRNYLDAVIGHFDREIQFYLACREHIERLSAAGVSFCFPELRDDLKEMDCRGVFDLALAAKLAIIPISPVTNDVRLSGAERILVVSGANQGGKTTFARMIGQLHYLARLGCPVPGTVVKLSLVNEVFTHFEREEDLSTLRSKLEEDLVRIHAILERAAPESLLIMNESFSSSTVRDALFLSGEVLRQIMRLDAICVFVTFLDELSTLGPSTVSLVSTVKPEDPSQRTFKIVRQPADGLAYALAIAAKHGLTYERTRSRLTE